MDEDRSVSLFIVVAVVAVVVAVFHLYYQRFLLLFAVLFRADLRHKLQIHRHLLLRNYWF